MLSAAVMVAPVCPTSCMGRSVVRLARKWIKSVMSESVRSEVLGSLEL
jgi:hypothetical protein